jgi:hypothetical protein
VFAKGLIMAIKNLKIDIRKSKAPIDPIEIFEGLTLRGPIENIWGPQQEALKQWHNNHRKDVDNVIQMNTGGGKTLVGLLIAQSLLNETNGYVLYLCANNQLVEQTIQKAKECGFIVASRYSGEWEEQLRFDSGEAFCITNYASVFNGLSIFRDKQIDALVFDDAHVAENEMRGQFTITIMSGDALFKKVLNIYRSHFARSPYSSTFEDVTSGKWDSLLYVPMFVAQRCAVELRQTLIDNNIEDTNNIFPWQYLKNHLGMCCVFLSGHSIQITPSILPLHKLQYFNDNVRRVYLTATVPTQTSFIRTFGVLKANVISPKGKSGDAQRLFVFIPGADDEEQKQVALNLIGKNKSCVISPSKPRADQWVPPAKVYDSTSGHKGIQEFADSRGSDMLALVARYDGIDLPGNACRILILDRLPKGVNLFDKFIDQSVQIDTLRSSHTATRIVQAIGRIFRSNTDHGVVMLRGSDLQGWLTNPKNRRLLPEVLQRQIQLGISLYEQVNEEQVTYTELITGILEGSNDWDTLYRGYIDQYTVGASEETSKQYHQLLFDEKQAYEQLWDGQFPNAIKKFETLVDGATQFDERLAAWFTHWLAFAYQINGDMEGATVYYNTASNIRVELGRPKIDKGFKSKQISGISIQAKNLAKLYRANKKKINTTITVIESELVYGKETNKAEEAVKLLGSLLGLSIERPDKSQKSGPDTLWLADGAIFGAAFELKTNKDKDGEYSKNDIKDCNDHHSWLETKYPGKIFIEAIIGYYLKVLDVANPRSELHVIEIESLRELLERIKLTLKQVELSGSTEIENEFQRWLDYYGLLWPNCLNALPYKLAIDLKNIES